MRYARTQAYLGTYPSEFELVPGDLLLVMTCQTQGGEILGVPGWVPDDGRTYLHNQRLGKVVVRDGGSVDLGYIYWLLADPGMRSRLVASATGSTVLHTSPSRIGEVEVWIPPLGEQQRIAGVLGALDDKIELNRRLEQRLADLAQLRFRDTVARTKPSSRPATLTDIASSIRAPADDDAPYIGLDAMPRGSTILTEWSVENAPNGQASGFRRGDVLFGKLRPYFKKTGVAPIDGRCSTEILVLRPREPQLWGPLVGYVSSDAFIAHCVQVSRGTKMPRSEWKDASAFPVAIPSSGDMERLTQQMRLLYDAAIALVHESKSLAAIRDALLPRLVSGQIRVPSSYVP